jgi:hypothetical protein
MKKEAEGMLGVPDGWGEYFTPFGFGTRRRNNSNGKSGFGLSKKVH